MTAPTPPTARAARTSPSITWYPYDPVQRRLVRELWAPLERLVEQDLTDDAFMARDGSSRVRVTRLEERCEALGVDQERMKRLLLASGCWELCNNGAGLRCTWLADERELANNRIEGNRRGGFVTAEKKRAAATKNGGRPRTPRARKSVDAAPSDAEVSPNAHTSTDSEAKTPPCNSLPDEGLQSTTGRPAVDQRTVTVTGSTSSSCPSGKQEEEVLPPPPAFAGGASDAVASRADGATATLAKPVLRAAQDFRHLRCLTAIEESAPPVDWAGADVAQLVAVLDAAGTGVEVERALYRVCARHQRRPGDDRHLPLLNEVRALLDGAEGRAGWLDPVEAPRALALALHGVSGVPMAIAPVFLRATASAIAVAMRTRLPDEDPKRIAARIAFEFEDSRYPRHAVGYTLPCDCIPEKAPIAQRTPVARHG